MNNKIYISLFKSFLHFLTLKMANKQLLLLFQSLLSPFPSSLVSFYYISDVLAALHCKLHSFFCCTSRHSDLNTLDCICFYLWVLRPGSEHSQCVPMHLINFLEKSDLQRNEAIKLQIYYHYCIRICAHGLRKS